MLQLSWTPSFWSFHDYVLVQMYLFAEDGNK